MAVNESLSAYSTLAAGNTPAGSDTIGPDLDNHLRNIKSIIREVGENAQGTSQPEAITGRLWFDTTDTATNRSTLNIHDGVDFTPLLDIETSAHNITSANFALSAIPGTQIDLGSLANSAIAASSVDFTGLSGSAIARAAIDGLGTTVEQDVGTAVGNVPQLISGSATSTPALPTLSAENLNALHVEGAQVAVATQTEMEAATVNTVAALATAGNVNWHPGVAKVTGYVTVSAGVPTLQVSHNVASITDSGTGQLTVTIDTDFSSVEYTPGGIGGHPSSTHVICLDSDAINVGSFFLVARVLTGGTPGTADDPGSYSFTAHGDQ